jgi:hypothetical protein
MWRTPVTLGGGIITANDSLVGSTFPAKQPAATSPVAGGIEAVVGAVITDSPAAVEAAPAEAAAENAAVAAPLPADPAAASV